MNLGAFQVAGEISYLFWLYSVQQECASYTRINYGSLWESVPYCAAQIPMGLQKTSLFAQEQDLVLLIMGGHITLKHLCLQVCLMSNICSCNNCLSSKRNRVCDLTKIKVVHRQSCSNGVSGPNKEERSPNGHDSNLPGVSKRQYSKFRMLLITKQEYLYFC